MKLYGADELPSMRATHTFRTPPWAMLLFPLILVLLCGVMAWALVNEHLPGIFWLSVVIMAPLVPLILQINFVPTLRDTNWVLKIDAGQLYIMLRNYRNRHSTTDEPTIASFSFAEIASVGKQERKISTPSSTPGGEVHWTEQLLEIRLRDAVPNEFVNALEAERNRKPPVTGTVRAKNYYPSPVSCEHDTIRILWRGKHDTIRPSLEKTLDILSGQLLVHGAAIVDRRDPAELSDEEFDDMILELCQNGNRMDAARMLRRHRGFSLNDAVRFVDELPS